MEPKVLIQPGVLPEFAPKNVIFFSNLLSLFFGNDGQIDQLRSLVGSLQTYGGRLLPVLDLMYPGCRNVLVLEGSGEEALIPFFKDTLNLSLPEVVTLKHEEYLRFAKPVEGIFDEPSWIEALREQRATLVDGYVTDNQLSGIADRLGKRTASSVAGSKRGNNKVLLHQYLESEGYPVFDGALATSPEEVLPILQSLNEQGYAQAVLKSQIGASGIGILKYSTSDTSCTFPPYMFFEGPCLVQGWLDDSVEGVQRLASPSVQIYIEEETVTVFDTTEQILSSESVHEGNMSPPPCFEGRPDALEDMLDQAAFCGEWLHGQGYRGAGSVDFLFLELDGQLVNIVCEINARITGATYPSVLARHFAPTGAWLMRNIKMESPMSGEALLSTLDDAGHLFDMSRKDGVLPINFNLDQEGRVVKGQFLCLAPAMSACNDLLEAVRLALPIKGVYDRD